jgi:hypothetical protein
MFKFAKLFAGVGLLILSLGGLYEVFSTPGNQLFSAMTSGFIGGISIQLIMSAIGELFREVR